MPNQIKNITEQNYNTESNEQQNNEQEYRNEKDESSEVDLPIPEKRNDEITGINDKKPGENSVQNGQKPEVKNDNTDLRPEKDEKRKTGFDPENISEPSRNDKRGNEPERLERDDTTDFKTEDADWQQDKMNEADNQSGKPSQSPGEDTRDDSITQRIITETYDKTEVEKRDMQKMVCRQNTETSSNPSF